MDVPATSAAAERGNAVPFTAEDARAGLFGSRADVGQAEEIQHPHQYHHHHIRGPVGSPGQHLLSESPPPFDPYAKTLRCSWADCGFTCHFTQSTGWREHRRSRGVCRSSRNRARCCFTACNDSSSSFASIQEAYIHEDTAHTIWVCISCKYAFSQSNHALRHIKLEHPMIVVAETAIKVLWMLHRPAGHAFSMELGSCVDLERPLVKLPFEEGVSPSNTRLLLLHDSNNPPEYMKAAVTRYLAANMTTLNAFLADTLPLDDANGRFLTGYIEQQTQIPLGQAGEAKPWGNTGSVPTTSARLSSVQSASVQPTPLFTDPNAKPAFFDAPAYQARRPHRESSWHVPQVLTSGEAPEPRPRLHRRTSSGGFEPLQEKSLSGEKQREYFLQMQDCIVEAAFDFYIRHHKILDTVTDRKRRPLCCATAGRERITNKNDLTLPQWTHLLRRLSDAKGLLRNMVSRLESFNGEIQPVDEVRHAYSKKKEKSDRDVLALVQVTRCFCWQLRDWEKCSQLDDLYETVEARIALAKREKEWLMQGVDATPLRPMPPTRTSATWPKVAQ